MGGLSTLVLWLATLVMEVSWLGAAAAFVVAAWTARPFPAPDALACCMVASVLTRLTARRGWRGIQIAAAHALAVSLFVLRDMQLAWAADAPFWGFAWLDRLAGAEALPGPLPFGLLVSATLALWWSGVLHARRSPAYREVCARFDLGMYWLFGLLFFRLLLRGQAGVPATEPIADALALSFFAFGICAIAIARNRGGGTKQLMRGSRGIGVLLGLGAAALLGTAGAALLFLPYLRAVSEHTHAEIATLGKPVANRAADGMIYVIKWMLEHPLPVYTPGRMVVVGPVTVARVVGNIPPEQLTESDPRQLWLFLGVASVCVLAVVVWLKRRWLFSRTERARRPPSQFLLLLRRFWQRVIALWRGLLTSGELEPIRLYAALVKWGARTGLPRASHETPLEYGERLKLHLAPSSADIDLIVSTFNLHVYAQVPCDFSALVRVRTALRRLRSPRLWIRRFMIWLRSSARHGAVLGLPP